MVADSEVTLMERELLNHARIDALPNPEQPSALPQVRLFAVLGTWMEADVVEATVRNALVQGCERVYLVDNDSRDETVALACAQGAVLARSFCTDRYNEVLRLRHMNDVVREVSANEPDEFLWWLYIDADEFPHGPRGMTLLDYLRTLDRQFRVVGARYLNHYPGKLPHYQTGRHPLDFQPLCEEISVPMCPSGHRKHPLLRYDRFAAPIQSDRGFHLVRCDKPVWEPAQPIFIHHFPFRERAATAKKLDLLWGANEAGSRADTSYGECVHMLARRQSFDAVYNQRWDEVVNFVAIDPMADTLESPPAPSGVSLKNWTELVEEAHWPVLRWYPMQNVWKYDSLPTFAYGDDTTYIKGMEFLDGHGTIEDWGCGFGHAKNFVHKSEYIGVDGSSPFADKKVDLISYTSDTECIFMRHVLEHNADWRRILANAVASFKRRMVLVVFTPFGEVTRSIATSTSLTTFPVPDISFRREDLTQFFSHLVHRGETLTTDTQYGEEHIFYIQRDAS